MRNFSLLVIATVVLVQVHQACSFYSIYQTNPAPAHQPEARVEPVQQDGAAFQQQPAQQQQRFRHHHVAGGHGGLAGLGGGMLQIHFNPHKIFQHHQNMGMGGGGLGFTMHHPFVQHHHQRKEFYHQCGTSVRHCEWVQQHHSHQVKAMSHKFVKAHQQDHIAQNNGEAKVEMVYSCITVNHICVGNTENCVSNRSCDVAMKVSEMKVEVNGEEKMTSVSSVARLNNCHIAGQSVTDSARMPQMLFAIGFATYDETGNKLECRRPKANDFKLIFLWKNSTVEESEDNKNGRCVPKPEHHQVVHHYDPQIMNTITLWPTVCNAMENKDETFSLKSFLTSRVPSAEYTPAFSPPFSFADTYEPQFSSNGMVISGVVSN